MIGDDRNMSAKDLEDFIRIIESAEASSTSSIFKKPPSIVSSYSSDIFGSRTKEGSKDEPKPNRVPKLWNADSGSEFLGSSAGSVSVGKTSTRESVKTSNISSNENSTPPRSGQSATSNNLEASSPSRSLKSSPLKNTNANPLIALQRHASHGRIQAKDLSPAATPDSSPLTKKRTLKEKKGSKDYEAEKYSADPKSEKQIRKKEKIKKNAPIKSNPSNSSSATIPSTSSSNSPVDKSVIEVFHHRDPSPGSPRPPPSPAPRLTKQVTIRQSSVKVHNHQKSASITEATKIPKPAPRKTVRRRPRSAPGKKKALPVQVSTRKPEVDLRNFSKSLKLLGLDIPSKRTEATVLTTHNINIRTTSPTIRTRLKERTQSVTDLQEVIDSKPSLPKEDYLNIKEPLCKAVFEEWYFRKKQEETEKKLKEYEEKENDEYEKELEVEEKRKKSEEAIEKWMRLKRIEILKQSRKQNELGRNQAEKEEEKKQKVMKAKEKWLQDKAKETQKKKQMEMEMKKKLEKQELEKEKKKEAFESHFQAWKAKVDAKLKKQLREAKQMALQDLEDRKRDAIEKREAAEAAFNAWKKKKMEQEIEHQRIQSQTIDPTNDSQEKLNKEAKRKEALKAYDSWLDYVEQREIEEQCIEEERQMRYLWRPPWYPAGVSEI